MMTPTPVDPAHLPLPSLVERCAEERAKFRRQEPSDPVYSLELFRRALGPHADDSARDACWEAVYVSFSPDVLQWVRYHPATAKLIAREPMEGFVNEAFARMYNANARNPLSVTSLGEILSFLKRCVSSVMLDALRAQRDKETPWEEEREIPTPDPSEDIFQQMHVEELWKMVESCLVAPREHLVARAFFIEGYAPREIPALYPNDFADVQDVRRCLANIVDRLRRRFRP
jgi:DNA-directed RNA polymerase specialized sigma24 family protein